MAEVNNLGSQNFFDEYLEQEAKKSQGSSSPTLSSSHMGDDSNPFGSDPEASNPFGPAPTKASSTSNTVLRSSSAKTGSLSTVSLHDEPAPASFNEELAIGKVKCSLCHQLIPIEEIDDHSNECYDVSAKDAKDRQAAHEATKAAAQSTTTAAAAGAVSTDKYPKIDSKPYEMPPVIGLNQPKSISETTKLPPQLDRDYVKGAGVIVIVDQPQVTPGSKVVTFRISAKSNMTEFAKKSSVQVRRTFAELQQFYRHLLRLYPYMIVPPLVDRKKMLQSETDLGFMAIRARHCQRFLNRIGIHPYLCRTELFRNFLTIEGPKDYQDYFNSLDAGEKEQAARPRKWKLFSGSFPASDLNEQKALDTLKQFKVELAEAEKVFRELAAHAKNLVLKHDEISKSITSIGVDLTKLPKLNSLSSPISAVKTSSVLTMLKTLGKTWTKAVPLDKAIGEVESDGLYELLKDWAYYCKVAGEFVIRAEAHRSLTNNSSLAAINHKNKVDSDSTYMQILKMSEEDKVLLHLYNQHIVAEVQRFDELRNRELVNWAHYYARRQMDAHQQWIERWKKFDASVK